MYLRILFLCWALVFSLFNANSQSNKYQGDALADLLNKSKDAPEVKSFHAFYKMKEYYKDAFIQPLKGIIYRLDERTGIVKAIELNADNKFSNAFEADLPLGLKWGMLKEDVELKLGKPESEYNFSGIETNYHFDRSIDLRLKYESKDGMKILSVVILQFIPWYFEPKTESEISLNKLKDPNKFVYLRKVKNTTSGITSIKVQPKQASSSLCDLIGEILPLVKNGNLSVVNGTTVSGNKKKAANTLPGSIETFVETGSANLFTSVIIKNETLDSKLVTSTFKEWEKKLEDCYKFYRSDADNIMDFDQLHIKNIPVVYKKDGVQIVLEQKIKNDGKVDVVFSISKIK